MATAVAGLAAALWLFGDEWARGPGSGPSSALAATVERLRAVRTASYRTVSLDADGDSQVWQTKMLGRRLMRVERPDGRVQVTDLNLGEVLLLTPDQRQARLLVGPRSPAADPYLRLCRLATGTDARSLPEGQWQGRTWRRFVVREPHREMVVWVDPETQLPGRIQGLDSPPNRPAAQWESDEFRFDEPLDEGLFSLAPPQGYAVDDRRPLRMSAAANGREPRALMLDSEHGWGPARFGASIAELVAELGVPDAQQEPAPGRGLVLWYLADGVALHTDAKWGLAMIECFGRGESPNELHPCASRTSEGVGIGSRVQDVVAAWGTPSQSTATALGTTLEYETRRCTLYCKNDQVVRMLFRAPSNRRPH